MLMFLNLLELFIYLIGDSDFLTALVESFDFLSTLTLSYSFVNYLELSVFLFLTSCSIDIIGYSDCAPDYYRF